jgi:hypothetical protein
MQDIGLCVSYQESLSNFNFNARLLPEFQKRIPLRHCQWKNIQNGIPSLASKSPFKPIDQLNFELIPYDEFSRLRSQLKESRNPLFSRSNPILHLLFIMVDDIEVYKSVTKNTIKSWMTALSPSSEWLIIQVTNQDASKTGIKSYLSGSVFVR